MSMAADSLGCSRLSVSDENLLLPRGRGTIIHKRKPYDYSRQMADRSTRVLIGPSQHTTRDQGSGVAIGTDPVNVSPVSQKRPVESEKHILEVR